MLETFPFVILGLNADNGSDYINKEVATLLVKLLIEFTTVVDNIQHLVFKYQRLQKTRYKDE